MLELRGIKLLLRMKKTRKTNGRVLVITGLLAITLAAIITLGEVYSR